METTLLEIDAVPTFYRGGVTRSRLEARWLIAFDSLGVRWQYEPRRFKSADESYLPDLYLPGCRAYVEIKPEGVEIDEGKALLVQEARGEPLLWISGFPHRDGYVVSIAGFGGLGTVTGLRFALGRPNHGELWLCDIEQVVAIPLPVREVLSEDYWPVQECHALREAYRAATCYQFEGE